MSALKYVPVLGALLGLCLVFAPQASWSDTPEMAANLRIVSAYYGKPGASHPFDFSLRLQQTCGDRSTTCESFCSKAQIGGPRSGLLKMPFHAAPVCRVVYRCGQETTLTAESEDGETLTLSCKHEH